MVIDFSQYVESEKLSVPSLILPLKVKSRGRINPRREFNHREMLERLEKELHIVLKAVTEEDKKTFRRSMENHCQEFLNQLMEFLQSNKHIKELIFDSSIYSVPLQYLAQFSSLQNLRNLDLGEVDAGNIKAFAQSPYLENLDELGLSLRSIEVEDIRALVQSSHLQNLKKLSINNWNVDFRTVEAVGGLHDPRIEFSKLTASAYGLFYKFLLKKARSDDQTMDEEEVKEMVVHFAERSYYADSEKVIERILENRDRYPFSMSSTGQALLAIALVNRANRLVEVLVRKGVDVSVADRDGWTYLHKTAKYGNEGAAQVLIKAGADINAVDRYGRTPFIVAKRMDFCKLVVSHIAKLEAAGLYVSEENLRKKSQFTNASHVRLNDYLRHLENCKEGVKGVEKRNGSLCGFLRESDVNEMVHIWERNENVRNQFDNKENLEILYPEYADILICKANKVKREIFLHNYKPLIDVLSKIHKKDLQKMSLSDMEEFLKSRENDYVVTKQETGVTLINCFDYFKDVKERHIPKLRVSSFAQMIKNKGIISDLECPSNDALQNTKRGKLLVVVACVLTMAGIVSGVAVAVYLEMLAVGVTAGVCCLVAAAVTYYCNSFSNSLENSNAEVVVNQGENYNLR